MKNYRGNRQKQKSLVAFPLILLTMLLSFTSPATGETKKTTLKEAYMVIADGSKNKAEAEEKLEAYLKKGYPQHTGYEQTDKYPKLMVSDRIKGLNPGFWIVVAAIADDKEVANTLSQFIRSLGQASYVRQVWVEKPEKVKLLILDIEKMFYQCSNDEYQTPNHRWCKTEFELAEISIRKNLWGYEILQYCDKRRFKCESIEKTMILRGAYNRSKSTFQKKTFSAVLPYVFRSNFGDNLTFSAKTIKPYLDCIVTFPNKKNKYSHDNNIFSLNEKITQVKKFSFECVSMYRD